jgi:hypothetical protein
MPINTIRIYRNPANANTLGISAYSLSTLTSGLESQISSTSIAAPEIANGITRNEVKKNHALPCRGLRATPAIVRKIKVPTIAVISIWSSVGRSIKVMSAVTGAASAPSCSPSNVVALVVASVILLEDIQLVKSSIVVFMRY